MEAEAGTVAEDGPGRAGVAPGAGAGGAVECLTKNLARMELGWQSDHC